MSHALKGKVALVTGGSRGLGAATAEALADQGADVAISYVASADKAEALVARLQRKGVRSISIRRDQADMASARPLIDRVRVVADLGRLDILVNNAAVAVQGQVGASGRTDVLNSDRPLWTRHDRAGRPGAPLTSHAFVRNLKGYAKEAGIGQIHLHQTCHTYARLVAEQTGSIIETQDALSHKNAATTRVYVQRISIKRDKHSENIARLFNSDGADGTPTK